MAGNLHVSHPVGVCECKVKGGGFGALLVGNRQDTGELCLFAQEDVANKLFEKKDVSVILVIYTPLRRQFSLSIRSS